jgi:hypothetical protein
LAGWTPTLRQAQKLELAYKAEVRMSLEVATIPRCAECDARWLPTDDERWSSYLTDDEPPELAFFCPECRDRESSDD